MPSFKFFEPKHEKQPTTQFVEFSLSTNERKKHQEKENETEVETKVETKVFKALKVPNFSQIHKRQSVQPESKLTKCVEFSLSTKARGYEKKQKL